jgi:hypothetical protein
MHTNITHLSSILTLPPSSFRKQTPVSTICTDTINVGYRGDIVTVRENDSVHEACNALWYGSATVLW